VELAFEGISEQDIPELTEVMTRAFDDDTRKNLGKEKGGPPGYDDGEFLRKWVFSQKESRGYKILHEGRIVGAFIVFLYEGWRNTLGSIFVDPGYQDRGVATRAWEFIEATFPCPQGWRLETPSYAVKNREFYERKCGFRLVGRKEAGEHLGDSLIYEKD
jgi:hypothetical protein